LIHISTDAVFDGKDGDYSEEDHPSPVNVYGRTKLAGERIVRAVYPEATIARVNLFGWSPSGSRSLAEFFYYNLKQGNPVPGYRNVYFNPLLVNHLAEILLILLEGQNNGLIHIGGRDKLSKYEFGLEIARLFEFSPELVKPVEIEHMDSRTPRGKNLTMNVDKLIHVLDARIPDLSTGLEGLFTLYQQGYPQKIKQMVDYHKGGA
jgi:dTDP-4-dehydrorhamnose reductase